jgi:hypothetical protein
VANEDSGFRDIRWEFGRGPRLGEDMMAWVREEIAGALTWAMHEGFLHLEADEMQRDAATGKSRFVPVEPYVLFALPESSSDDPERRAPLGELIDECIGGHLPFGGTPLGERLAMIHSLDDDAREILVGLRRLLHEKVELLDRVLARDSQPCAAESDPDEEAE